MSDTSNLDDDLGKLQAKFHQKRKSAQPGFQSPLFNQKKFPQQGFAAMGKEKSDPSMDDLLEQVKAQFHEKPSQSSSPSGNRTPGGGMDDLLEQVRAEFEQEKNSNSSPLNSQSTASNNSSLDDFLTQVRAEFQQKQKSRQNQSSDEDLEDLFAGFQSQPDCRRCARHQGAGLQQPVWRGHWK